MKLIDHVERYAKPGESLYQVALRQLTIDALERAGSQHYAAECLRSTQKRVWYQVRKWGLNRQKDGP